MVHLWTNISPQFTDIVRPHSNAYMFNVHTQKNNSNNDNATDVICYLSNEW